MHWLSPHRGLVARSDEPSFFWNAKGEVAGRTHAPAQDGERWKREGWKPMGGARRSTAVMVRSVRGQPARLHLSPRDRALHGGGRPECCASQ